MAMDIYRYVSLANVKTIGAKFCRPGQLSAAPWVLLFKSVVPFQIQVESMLTTYMYSLDDEFDFRFPMR